MSPPTLRKQIKRLESTLGPPLFVRTTGQVSLTPAGEAPREGAAALVMATANFETSARRAGSGTLGILRIGFGITALTDLLPQAIIAYGNAFPRVRLEMQDLGSRSQVDALLDGSMDLGFIRMPVRNAGLMTSVVLREEMLIAVGPSGKSS